MQVGSRMSELYSDPATQFLELRPCRRLLPARPTIADPVGCMSTWSDCAKQGLHGDAFTYKSVNTDSACWAMQR